MCFKNCPEHHFVLAVPFSHETPKIKSFSPCDANYKLDVTHTSQNTDTSKSFSPKPRATALQVYKIQNTLHAKPATAFFNCFKQPQSAVRYTPKQNTDGMQRTKWVTLVIVGRVTVHLQKNVDQQSGTFWGASTSVSTPKIIRVAAWHAVETGVYQTQVCWAPRARLHSTANETFRAVKSGLASVGGAGSEWRSEKSFSLAGKLYRWLCTRLSRYVGESLLWWHT